MVYTTRINQPQAGVLSVDGVAKRPIVVDSDGEDNIVVRPIGVITQAFDHRAIDGAYSRFLKRLGILSKIMTGPRCCHNRLMKSLNIFGGT